MGFSLLEESEIQVSFEEGVSFAYKPVREIVPAPSFCLPKTISTLILVRVPWLWVWGMGSLREALIFLANKPQALRLLREAARYKALEGKPPYTRELLSLAANGDRGYSMRLLEELQALGLLRRYRDYLSDKLRIPVVRNDPTPLAHKVLAFFEEDVNA